MSERTSLGAPSAKLIILMSLHCKRSFYITSSLTRDDTLIGVRAQKTSMACGKSRRTTRAPAPAAPSGYPQSVSVARQYDDPDARVRVTAAKEILDRAHGKPATALASSSGRRTTCCARSPIRGSARTNRHIKSCERRPVHSRAKRRR